MHSTIRKSAMQNGLIIGLLLSLEFIFSTQKNFFLGSLSLVISIYIVILMYKLSINFRESEYSGSISYWKAASYVFQIYYFGLILLFLIVFFYTSRIDTSYLKLIEESTLKLYQSRGFKFNDMELKILDKFCEPLVFTSIKIFFGLLLGAFWALILAAFVKKEKSIF